MDSIIPLGQKNTLAEYMILSGADNRPSMLDKDFPLIWPTVEENGVIRIKKYAELSAAKKIQADCDMKATNIILQGLPADIYSPERECKMYDAFDKFTHIKGETLHKYYLRFTQLINDMNIYNMKIEQFQMNTKFLNSLPLEWSKFMTDVKLVKDLHTTNFDQLHAYLEQHELHANKVRLLRERNQDPLSFVATQQMTPPHFNTYQSSYNNPQLQQQFSPSQFGSIHPNQHYSSTYPSQPQFNHSSVPSSYPYQSQMNHQTSYVPQIAYQSPQVTTQPMIESPLIDSSFDVPVFSLGDDPIACLNKAMVFLTVVASLRSAVEDVNESLLRLGMIDLMDHLLKIIMVNVIPPDHDHDVPVVEPNQHDDAPVVPEPVLEDEDEDPEEDEFEEEEDPQEDEDDMEIDIEEDENEPELTYPYEEVDPLNPPPPASESEPDDEIEVENPIEHEDETIPVSVYEVGESSTVAIPREDGDRFLHGFMTRDIDSLFDLGNEVRSSVEQGTAVMEKLVEKLKNVEEKAECKKRKKELKEARLSSTFLRMQNERVERDLYWTRVRAHDLYQEMIRRGFVFEERPNEAIDVSIEDEKSPLSEPRGSLPDV
ncbi:hypothetical protein Tco_0910022 [Tanacetum coccineum]|uniref:Uncharacterized protein n=1 Tax=Tanacetum coccineum TaxID=301880 RepID=A0ABQ5CUG6_9ASTR